MLNQVENPMISPAVVLRNVLPQYAAIIILALLSHMALGQSLPPIERIDSIHTNPPNIAEGQGFDMVVVGNGAWTADGADIAVDEVAKTIIVSPLPLFCGTPIGQLDIPNHVSIPIAPLASGVYSVYVELGVPWGCRSVTFQHELEVVSLERFSAAFNSTSPPNRMPEVIATHESPAAGQVVSGVGLLRGWACYDSGIPWPTVGKITFSINDAEPVRAVHGSSRLDTQESCGIQARASGYGFVINWNLLGVGEHNLKLFVDDNLFKELTFSVAGFNQEFISGLTAQYQLIDFLMRGDATTIEWSQSDQSFIVTEYLQQAE